MAKNTIKRSDIQTMIGEALGQHGIPMKANIATTFPGVNPLAYGWGQCRIYGPFAKDGMDADKGGLSYASVVKAAPKTLGDFETKCIEPWFKKNGWTITL
jgi:hypothetical protein